MRVRLCVQHPALNATVFELLSFSQRLVLELSTAKIVNVGLSLLEKLGLELLFSFSERPELHIQ